MPLSDMLWYTETGERTFSFTLLPVGMVRDIEYTRQYFRHVLSHVPYSKQNKTKSSLPPTTVDICLCTVKPNQSLLDNLYQVAANLSTRAASSKRENPELILAYRLKIDARGGVAVPITKRNVTNPVAHYKKPSHEGTGIQFLVRRVRIHNSKVAAAAAATTVCYV